MRVAVLRERREFERRVAATPDSVRKLAALGLEPAVEAGAGAGAHFADRDYADAGATVAPGADAALDGAGLVLAVQRPDADVLSAVSEGAAVVGLLDPLAPPDETARWAEAGLTTFALELLPRISRAQGMDALSSQSSLAGYRAVVDAAAEFGRAFPLMMTAAGTIAPARVLVLGAGVAGLQAIATARRLGAIVSANDVRAAAAEQVRSLGATFVGPEEDDAEGAGGYARELDADARSRQAGVIADTLAKSDIAVCTALVPGREAPVLIDAAMVEGMKPGSVIVDLAVEQGGNCALSVPGEIVEAHGVRILGHRNVPSRIATDASAQYARNLVNFLALLTKDGTFAPDWEDEVVRGVLVTRGGKVVHPRLAAA